MRDSFVSPFFRLELSSVKLSFVERSPRFKDTFFTKYSFPFEFKIDRDLKTTIGNFSSLNINGLKGSYDGFLVFEGKVNVAKLEIIEVTGDMVSAQIDAGFEELPNFGKKLSELPLENKGVGNIYNHAEIICKKQYPEVNYNFPRVIYNKHSSDEKGWELFNGFLNDRKTNVSIFSPGTSSSFVTNNELDQDGAGTGHKNRNIIHPMPYLLYVLKAGFLNAGFELKGEILNDEDFYQCVLFSNKEYFQKVNNEPLLIDIKGNEHIDYKDSFYHYKKEFNIEKKGKYLFQGEVRVTRTLASLNTQTMMMPVGVKITCNGKILYRRFTNYSYNLPPENLFFEFETDSPNSLLQIFVISEKVDQICKCTVSLRDFVDESGADTFQIHNNDRVNISMAVPDITFGELVTIVKNWKNYDLEIKDNYVFMNKLATSTSKELKDFTSFLSTKPTKSFLKKRSFLISFPEMDNEVDNLDSVYIDENGVKINGVANEDTSNVKINGYVLPIEVFKGVATAAIKKSDSSILSLIYYDGLVNGQNLAKKSLGLNFPQLLNSLVDWYEMRINTTEIKWSFIVNKNKFRHINLRDNLYGYSQKLWIKEITKNVIDERNYQIDIVTEVVK